MTTESVFNEIESTAYIMGGLFFLALSVVALQTAIEVLRQHPYDVVKRRRGK